MSTFTIKVKVNGDIRRFQVPTTESFSQLEEKIAHIFSGASVSRVTWEDEDGDEITVSTEADWAECTAGRPTKSVIRLAAQLEVHVPEKASTPASTACPRVTFGIGVPAGAKSTASAAAAAAAAAPEACPETCHLSMIIDRSGSMASLGDSVLSGIQTYLHELAAVDERDGSSTSVLFSTFDDKYQVKHACLPIKEAQTAITAQDIEPRGMTALHDAIGYGLRDTRAAIKAMGPRKPGKVVVFILTDGQENSSKKWNSASVRKQIAKLEAAPYNYAFFFAAAGQDALDTGASMGLGADDCITWTPDSRAASACFGAVAEATTSHRRGMSKAFTPVHRRSTLTGDAATTTGGGGFSFGGGGFSSGAPTTPRRRSHHIPAASSSNGLYGGGVVGSNVHTGVVCDVSGMNPIVGVRCHLMGSNYDLCHAQFEKLPHAQRARFEVIVTVGATPVPYSTDMTRQHHRHGPGELFGSAAAPARGGSFGSAAAPAPNTFGANMFGANMFGAAAAPTGGLLGGGGGAFNFGNAHARSQKASQKACKFDGACKKKAKGTCKYRHSPAAPAQAPADVGAVAASARPSARPSALGKKWEKELAELDAMGLTVFRDGMPELLERTNGSIAKVLELLMP